MLHALTRTLLGISFAAIMIFDLGFQASTAHAVDACRPHELAGSWGLQCRGTFVNPDLGLTSAVSVFRFTRGGDLYVTEAQRLPDGTISHHTATGTYEVNPDCTATMQTYNDIDHTRILCAVVMGRDKKEAYALVEEVELADGTMLDVDVSCTLQKQ